MCSISTLRCSSGYHLAIFPVVLMAHSSSNITFLNTFFLCLSASLIAYGPASPFTLTATLFVVYVSLYVTYQWNVSPLSRYPGPKLAALTDLV